MDFLGHSELLLPISDRMAVVTLIRETRWSSERQNMETWYHSCGYPILVSSRQVDGREVVTFFDSDPKWADRKISECPGCERTLRLANLTPEVEHEDPDQD
jgi:hypothetical protein